MQTHIIKGGSQREILGFHWVSQSPFIDFAMIHSGGLDLYKLPSSGVKLQHIRNYPGSVSHYWVEPVSGLLVLALANKPGTLLTFFLKQLNGPKAFEGPKVTLRLETGATSFWTSRPANVSNLSTFVQTYENDPHRLAVFKLYDGAYIAHIATSQGALTIYQVTQEEIRVLGAISLVPGGCDIREWDNLLIVQNYTSQFSLILDIHSVPETAQFAPFCLLHHLQIPSTCRLSTSFYFLKSAHDYSLRLSISYTNFKLESPSPATRQFALDTECPLSRDLLYVDSNIAVDMRKGICYRLELVVPELVAERRKRLESVRFLLRRQGEKHLAVSHLRKAILEGTALEDMSEFFSEVNLHYKSAAIERKGSSGSNSSRKSMPSSPQDTNSSTPRRKSPGSQPEIKIETGETVLLQAEMSSLVFLPALEDFSVDPEYLTCVVVEYQRALACHDIQVHQSIQLLSAKLLIRTGNFSLLHSLIQFQVLADSKELATMLLAIANGSGLRVYPAALQLALDMLGRLGLQDEVVEALLDRGMVLEAASCGRDGVLSEDSRKRLQRAAKDDFAFLLNSL